jgi:hypothetical protein
MMGQRDLPELPARNDRYLRKAAFPSEREIGFTARSGGCYCWRSDWARSKVPFLRSLVTSPCAESRCFFP